MDACLRLPLVAALRPVPLTPSFAPSAPAIPLSSRSSLSLALPSKQDETLSRAIELIKSRPVRTAAENFEELTKALSGMRDDSGKELNPVEMAVDLLRHVGKFLR